MPLPSPADLKKVYLFESLGPSDLEWLAKSAGLKEVIAGDQIFSEGEPARSFFIMKQGTLEIRKKGVQDEQQVAFLGAGSVIGEMAFLNSSPRTASAVAKENCSLYEFPYAQLEKRVQETPEFGMKLYKALALHLSRRIQQTTGDLASLKELKLRTN